MLDLPPLGTGLNWWLGRLSTEGRVRVNQAPVAPAANQTRPYGQPLRIKLSDLLASCSDADSTDGDSVTAFELTGTGTPGATVTTNGTYLLYTPASGSNQTDTLTYRVHDARGGVSASADLTIAVSSQPVGAAQEITVTGGTVTVVFQAVPGWHYDVERAETASGPWVALTGYQNVVPDANARITVTDTPPAEWTSAFYRLKWLGN